MKKLSICLALLFFIFIGHLFSQDSIKALIIRQGLSVDYPFLYKVNLDCKMSYNKSDGFYFYNYTLINDSINKGDIFIFEINITRSPGSVLYDTLGLKFANGFENYLFKKYYPPAANLVESVGFPSLPNSDWDVTIAHNSAANFGVDTMPQPGSTVTGFIMMSRALPGIRAFRAYPYFNVYEFYPDEDADTTAVLDSIYYEIESYVDSVRNTVNYNGWTIGPKAPPAQLNNINFLDTLLYYNKRSLDLGWIKTQATYDKYESYYDTALAQLQQNNVAGARAALNNILNNLNLDSRSDLTDEAYALLKYNTGYLLANLPHVTSK